MQKRRSSASARLTGCSRPIARCRNSNRSARCRERGPRPTRLPGERRSFDSRRALLLERERRGRHAPALGLARPRARRRAAGSARRRLHRRARRVASFRLARDAAWRNGATGSRSKTRPTVRSTTGRRGSAAGRFGHIPMAHRALRMAARPCTPPPSVCRSCTATTGSATFSNTSGRISAILDWELVHLGDPVEDLGWAFLPQYRGGTPLVCGLASEADFLARYEAQAGLPGRIGLAPFLPRLFAAEARLHAYGRGAMLRGRTVQRHAHARDGDADRARCSAKSAKTLECGRMNNSLPRLIDGMVATLRKEVIPRVEGDFARGQAFGVIYMLKASSFAVPGPTPFCSSNCRRSTRRAATCRRWRRIFRARRCPMFMPRPPYRTRARWKRCATRATRAFAT